MNTPPTVGIASSEVEAAPTAPLTRAMENQAGRARRLFGAWSLEVLLPFAITRFGLLLVGWFGRYLPFNATYNDELGNVAARGWAFSPNRLLDMWGRWDTHWYAMIVRDGYRGSNLATREWTDVAFFPLFPGTARLIYKMLPGALQTRTAALTILVVMANLLAVAALSALYSFGRTQFGSDVARRATWYVLAFPTGFYLSAAYTESLFLFLLVSTFIFATRHRWALAGICGSLLALTRPPGVLVAIPVAWLYLENIKFQWRRVRPHLLFVAIIPLGFAMYGLFLRRLTGDPLAIFHAQLGWGRSLSAPWETLSHPVDLNPFITPIDQVAVCAFAVAGIVLLFRMPSASYGLFTLVSLAPVLLAGRLNAAARYVLVLFPVFLLMARAGANAIVDRCIMFVFTVLQGLFMFAWSQGYWVD